MRIPLIVQPGISSDDTAFASVGRWADGNNMRPWRKSMQTIGGWGIAVSGIEGVCRNVMAWTDNDGVVNVGFGTHSHLQVYVNGTLYDITPSSGFTAGAVDGAGGPGFGSGEYDEGTYGVGSVANYFPNTWSLANWGENLMAVPRYQTLFIWDNNTANDATAVTNAPDNIVYMLVTKRQVLAFGCNEVTSGTFNPMCIRGSALRDYTNWTPGSTSTSFEEILSGSGRIVAARQIGDAIGVWTDSAFYIGEYIGSATQIYRFTLVAQHCGLIGPNAAQVINQTVIWVTPDYQFYVWAPGGAPVLLDCPIRNDFRDNVAQGQFDKIAATSVGQYGEVWWFYPDARDGLECSRYVAVSSQGGEWFRGQIARTAAVDAGPTEYPCFVTSDGTAYWHENGHDANGGVLEWSLTTADQYVDEAGRTVFIRAFYPDFEDQLGGVDLTLTLRKAPQASTTYTKGPYPLTLNKSKADFRATGAVASATFSCSSAPAFARFGRPNFDAVVTGER